MNLDFSISDVIVGIIAFIGVVLTLRQNKKIGETHQVTTINHHSSERPTIPDRLDNIEKAQAYTLDILNQHLKEHKK
jgi:hypothetical protein